MHLNRKVISRLKSEVSRRIKKNITNNNLESNPRPILKKKMNKNNNFKIINSVKHNNNGEEKIEYKPVHKWKNLLSGHTAFILGNSPSITNYNLSLLNDYFTIGINRIFYIYDPTLLMWQDRQIWNSDKKKIVEQKSIKFSSYSGDPRRYFINFRVIDGGFRFANDPEKLYGHGNTGALAIQLSVILGCSNIVLLGTDCKYGVGGKTDFYGRNKDHKPYTLKMCLSAMQWAKENCPIPIYNCSESDLWPKERLIDVIQRVKPIKMGREKYKELFSK